MQDLFYTESDKKLFWVSGYEISESNVISYTNKLIADATKFANVANCDVKDVKSSYIEKSRRYKIHEGLLY